MVQKVLCGYSSPISKFKSNPGAVLAGADGQAVAVSAHNQIQFYAVPARLYEELLEYVEIKQRGTTRLEVVPANFALTGDMVERMTEKLKHLSDSDAGDFMPCKNNG